MNISVVNTRYWKARSWGMAALLILAAACTPGSTPAPPEMVPTPPPTATATRTPIPPSPTAKIDSFALTATTFVLHATETVSAELAATNELYRQSIQGVPTLSASEIEDLRARWTGELEAAAGFSHPLFADMIENLSHFSDYESDDRVGKYLQARTIVDARDYHLVPEVVRTDYAGSTYVAILVQNSLDLLRPVTYWLIIFRITDGGPIALVYGEMVARNADFGRNGDTEGFADRNANGYPDLALYKDPDMGNSGCIHDRGLTLYEIRPPGTIIDITPGSSNWEFRDLTIPMSSPRQSNPLFADFRWYASRVRDLDGDGVMEIEAEERFSMLENFSHCEYSISRWYGWDGSAYRNISATLEESLWSYIGAYWDGIRDQEGCLLPSTPMYQMLWSYVARGTFEQGWALLEPRLRWDLCPDTLDERTRRNMIELVAWAGLTIAQERYETGGE